MPPTVQPWSVMMSFTTTALAPIHTLSEILTLPMIFAPVPMNTLSPIVAAKSEPFVAPIVTPSCMRQLAPIFAFEATTIVPTCAIDSPGPNEFKGIVNPNFNDMRPYFLRAKRRIILRKKYARWGGV